MPSAHGNDAAVDDLALVPIWAVSRRDLIRGRFRPPGGAPFAWEGTRESIVLENRDGGVLHLDCATLTARVDGRIVGLSSRGFLLVEHLIRSVRVVPAKELRAVVWGSDLACTATTVRAAVHNARKELRPHWSECVRTVRLQGYAWLAEEDDARTRGVAAP